MSVILADMAGVSPKIAAATLDGESCMTVRFNRRLPVTDWPKEKFKLVIGAGNCVSIRVVRPVQPRDGKSSTYILETAQPLDFFRQNYELHVEGIGRCAVRAWRILQDSEKFYDPEVQLGAIYSPERTIFRVFAPTAEMVKVVIADQLESDIGVFTSDMQRNEKGIWTVSVERNLEGKYYAYQLSGPGFDPQAEITDIYAVCTQNRYLRSMIVNLAKTDPPGFRDYNYELPTSPADAIIYELHVRDFTIAANSGVKQKGRYLGLAETGTHLPGSAGIKTGLDHLVELGVTHVQIMPVQDFDNFEDRRQDYNWGYMPVHFNSPDGWFASQVMGSAKIREFKTAVKAFHDRGIGVILDVVYNHTAGRASFERLVPGYYFRMTKTGHNFSNGSGCGNEFKSENLMARKFILDSVKFWAQEYQIDGFRFDVMGLIDLETMKQIKASLDAIRPGILLYGEPWVAGKTPLRPITNHRRIRRTGIGAFNDHFRDAIKGNRDGGAAGFIQVGARAKGVIQGLKGAINDWSVDPIDSINYFECHDNLTAWDKLLQSVPRASDPLRKRMMRFAGLILLTSQGTIFLHAGQEFCRTKKGHANSYNLPDEINQIDWSLKKTNADVYAYYRGLIALRKAHPVFRLHGRKQVQSIVSLAKPPNKRCIVYCLDGTDLPGESAGEIVVLLNGNSKSVQFSLPLGKWSIHADADKASVKAFDQVEGKLKVAAHSGMLLIQ